MSPKEIEDYLWRLQQSTRASSKLMIPWHDYLRLRFKWYYNWHLNPWTSKIHVSILGAYLLALIVGISLNFLTFSSPAPTHAAGQMQMASGSYAGNNVDNRSINGLGFKPDLVIVKSSSATDTFRTGWWRSSAMTGDDSASFYKEANSSNQIQSLDDDGFTVGNSLWINQNGQTYYWEAFKDNGGGDFKVGSYDGDSTDNRDITGFGFRPDLVVIKPSTVESHSFWRTSSQVGDVSQRMWAGQPVADNIQDFTDDGFQVGTAINTAATKHYYFAFKQVEGYFKVGTYTGDGTDDRNISGVGFQPDMLWVQQSQVADNKNIYYKPSALTGDAALTLINSNFAAPNYIQSLQADGFQVGTMLNTTPRLHLYAAWKNYAGMSNNRIWDGGGGIDTSWSNCTNWSDDICPTEAMSVLFDSTSSNNSTIDLQGTVANLSIDSGYTGTITVSSNIAISKNLNFGSGSLDAGSNTISIGGNAIFTGGVFNGNNASINVGGDWSTANENIFIAGTSTVNLTGGDQQILGTTTFNNLSKTTANACILRIQSSATQVINGALTFTGSSGNVLSLRPTTANTSWGFDPRGSRSIAYVDVQYGNNINVTPIELNLSTNSGNNTGDWTYINRLTQAIVGNGPFVMNLSNSEYILEENVTFPGTGLIMAGSNITLNLNNKTLSYGNTSMQDFPNFDFETDDLSSWTFSNGTFARSSATNRTMMNNWRISATDLAATGDIITSGWISLPTANKTYVVGIIGALDSNQGINVQVSIDIKANADNSITMGAWTSPDIGLWHAPFASVQFKPVNISDYTFRLRITKTGGTGTLASFDYAKIRPAYDAGVVLYSTYENTQFPDLASYPAARTRPLMLPRDSCA
jgi:hypothetical protein